MTFTKEEEIIILKSLHRIMAKLDVHDLPLFWDLVRVIEKRGRNIEGRGGKIEGRGGKIEGRGRNIEVGEDKSK